MKKFLVTGGAGFIGSHIVEALIKKGHFVRILDNFSSGKIENLDFTKDLSPKAYGLIKGDIRDKAICLKVTKGVDFVLHQAALRSVPKSLGNPKEYNEVNIGGTLNMLEAARQNKIKCFVFASSSSIYGEAVKFPEKEDDMPRLISPYALTKLAGEYYCKIFSKNYGLSTVSLRYFNVFGPRQALDDEYAVVIPKFITCMLNDEPSPIYGTGRQSRDFTYVDNVVAANILAAQKGNLSRRSGIPQITPMADSAKGGNAGKGEVFNVASGKDYSILGLVEALNKIMKKDIKPVFLPLRPGDVFKTLADLSRAKRILGFKPKIGFPEGLELTVEYFKEL